MLLLRRCLGIRHPTNETGERRFQRAIFIAEDHRICVKTIAVHRSLTSNSSRHIANRQVAGIVVRGSELAVCDESKHAVIFARVADSSNTVVKCVWCEFKQGVQ